MNNRDYKNFACDEIYHVYNRGVGKMKIFNDNEDLKVFLFRLRENLFPEIIKNKNSLKSPPRRKSLPPNAFSLIAYCLMPNHFHFLIRQNSDLPISTLILKLCGGFSKYFNKKYERIGSLFQDQFKAVIVENNEQLLWTSLYIHENPLKAEMVADLKNYEWSSYLDYAGLRNGTLCKKELILEQFHSPKSYLEYFNKNDISKNIEEKLIGYQDLLIDLE